MDQSEDITVPDLNDTNPQLGFRSSLPEFEPNSPVSDLDHAADDEHRHRLHEEPQNLDRKESVNEHPVTELERLDLDEEEERNVKSEGSDKYDNWNEDDSGKVVEDGGIEKKSERRRYLYPVRPEAEDCSYYMKTGTCKFGSNCKFNHPVRRKNQAVKEKVKEREEPTEKPGQTECKYYLRTGGCKFGNACRYNHSKAKTSVAPLLELNFLGLPIRPGEKECPYYMRNGSCKFGANCKFNHPDPTAVGGGDPPLGYGNGGSVSSQMSGHASSQTTVPSWSSPMTLNETAPYVQIMFSPSQGVPSQTPEWNGYQAPVYSPDRSMHLPTAYLMNNPATETNVYSPNQPQILVDNYPERPGQPECTYFIKTGECKFKSNCRYHHPKNRTLKQPPCTLSDKGLPLRPDQNICTHYSRYGICKFGPACKFDHPIQPPSSTASGLDKPSPFDDSLAKEEVRIAGSGNGSDAPIQQAV